MSPKGRWTFAAAHRSRPPDRKLQRNVGHLREQLQEAQSELAAAQREVSVFSPVPPAAFLFFATPRVCVL